MILIVLLVITIAAAITASVYAKKPYNDTPAYIAFFVSLTGLSAFLVTGLTAVVTHIPLQVKNKRLDYEQRYQTITDVIRRDEKNSIVIAGEIADYNAEIMQGRNNMHDPWIGIMQYQFWDDLPLIEYEEPNASEIED